ncbi:proline-rich receptor-like kinase [Rhynchospora pubera]|uniref:Proline-rich receptor-like kinase n=1 Tax=Rhynchospora pubera TaxID=906938 RepID=A0AAV8E6H1_9POAL|nr:proline-rich receptor-like kinase [Rhynchospora pubera]
MPKRPLTSNYGQRSNPFVWTVAIVCTIIAIAVIISGIAVFSVYMIYRPKMPYLVVAAAHLNNLGYDNQFQTMDVDMSVTVLAENTNSKVDASFSNVALSVRFHRMDIARLQAWPFQVDRNSSRMLDYPVRSTPIPLDSGAMNEVALAINRGVINFGIYGKARTRWRVGIFRSVKFWTHLSCRLQFFIDNGTATGRDCSSKTL